MHLNLIYFSILLIGLAATMRSSSAYILVTEGLPVQERLRYGVYLFTFEGFLTSLTSVLFWYGLLTWRTYLTTSCLIMCLMLCVLFTFIPESACFLYEKGDFIRLESALREIVETNSASINPNYHDMQITDPRQTQLDLVMDNLRESYSQKS
jgi:hypothetical protein